MVKIILAVLIAALAACPYGASFRDCEITCTSATGCPSGFSCEASEGLCRPAGATESCASIVGDAGLDGPNDAFNVEAPSGLAYSTNPAVYTRGQAITDITPSSAGGVVASYSIDAALPTGLAFDTVTGVISGTPTVISPATSYTVTAMNSGGSTNASLSITVNDVAPSALVYATNPAVYPRGQSITNNTPSNNGGPVIAYSISAALPTGLSFDTLTGVISGTPTAITATASYTVTATNSGGSTTVALIVTVETPFTPSNLGSAADDLHAGTQDVILSNATINTDTGTITGVTLMGNETRIQVQTSPAPEIEVFRLKSLRIQGAVTVQGSRALTIVTVNSITITGSVQFTGQTSCTSGTSGNGAAGGVALVLERPVALAPSAT